MKKRMIIIAPVVFVLALAIAGGAIFLFTDWFRPQAQPILKGTLTGDTGAESAYSLEILKYGDIDSEYIKKWIDERKDNRKYDGEPVYYTLNHDDVSTPIDIYIFMPDAKEIMGDISLPNIKVSEMGETLTIYIESKTNITKTKDSADLILHIYVENTSKSPTAITERLFINGKEYSRLGAKFTNLK